VGDLVGEAVGLLVGDLVGKLVGALVGGAVTQVRSNVQPFSTPDMIASEPGVVFALLHFFL